MKYYKIMIKDEESGELKNLFHGVNNSRTMPKNEWIEAEKKIVVDGSGQEPYVSGFHIFKNKEEAKSYLDSNFRTEKNRVIVTCKARNLRSKERSRHDVYLADEIKLL